jgi:hypothetical protein
VSGPLVIGLASGSSRPSVSAVPGFLLLDVCVQFAQSVLVDMLDGVPHVQQAVVGSLLVHPPEEFVIRRVVGTGDGIPNCLSLGVTGDVPGGDCLDDESESGS